MPLAVGANAKTRERAFSDANLKFPHLAPEFSCSINHLRWILGLSF